MAIGRHKEGDLERPRRYYAFADHVADPGFENPKLRVSIQFDAVDADYFDSLPSELRGGFPDAETLHSDRGLSVIRVMTTHNRLEGMGAKAPNETDWLEVTIGKEKNTPRAWLAAADRGFVPGPGINAPRIVRIDQEDQAPLLSKLDAFCTAPLAKKVQAKEVLARMNLGDTKNLRITALDVGQASCTAFSDGRTDLGYFDVGKPLVFNRHSFKPGFTRAYPPDGFVLLSHWDFDHYALAISNPSLMTLDWYAPEQKVGLYTAKFQQQSGKRLHFITGDARANGVLLERALGTNPKDRNSTGYLLRFERNGEAVLLTGDADYAHISSTMKTDATALTLPHHGGRGSEPPKPAACLYPTAVASYGTPNNYKHPDEEHLKAHKGKGWRVKRTAAHGRLPRIPRTDRLLFPLGQVLPKPALSKRQLAAV